jgi:uncharacterized protein (DUF849 family)
MISPTGARLQKSDHPAVPVSIPEIVKATVECAALGAEALHLHVRGSDGTHSLDASLYREALAALNDALPGFPIQITTESAGRYRPAQQLALLEQLKPAWASIALREVGAEPSLAKQIYALCKEQKTVVQHIVYDAEDAARLREWQEQGVLGAEESVILVLGRYQDQRAARPKDLDKLRSALPPIGRWMVCAFGPAEHTCLCHAARLGGDLRVGFENSTHREDGSRWPSVAASLASLKHSLGGE